MNNNMDEMISYDIQHQEYLQRIRGFRLLDDDFMSKVFENKQCSELLLQVKLNETYIIFITENDIIKKGLPIYHIDRTIRETGELFGDASHIIYVNSQIKDETALGKLMHDFSCVDAKDMNYKVLAERVRYFKEDKEGIDTMCKAMEDMRNETAHEKAVEIAKRMLKSGKLSCEEIAEFAELSVDEIKSLKCSE